MTRESENPIHRMYKKNFESLGLFWWTEAQKDILPTVTLSQSIDRFYKKLGEPYDLNVAIVTVSRMRSEYIDLNYKRCCGNSTGGSKFCKETRV
jgi:hypothetical protein